MIRRRGTRRMNEVKGVEFSLALQWYLRDKRAEGVKDSTLATYKMHIDYFLKDLDLVTDTADFTTDLVDIEFFDMFVEDLQADEDKNDVTVATYCRSVRAFLYWLQENHYQEAFSIKIPKFQKRIKVCYSDSELATLLTKPEDPTEVQYEVWVFINLICATGLRLNSALDLRVRDIVEEEKMLIVNETKNNEPLALYLNNDMLKILKKYIALFELSPDNYLFCRGDGGRLNNNTMKGYVRDYNLNHGVEKTSIHLFRHTFSKNYYKEEKDIYTLSQILGHSSVAVTEQYLRDLGISLFAETTYNPQRQFAQKTGKRNNPKRRGKIKC